MKPGCWPFALAILLLLVIIIGSSGKSVQNPASKTIVICQIEYTALGKQANWHFNYIYAVKTRDDGSVEKIAKLENTKRPAFVNEEKMLDCIKTWKLSPSGKHVVMFSIGTSGGGNFISVVDPNRDSLKLVL